MNMSGFLEKITLYDLLGYTIPGFVFLLIMLYGVYSTDTLVLLETYKNYNGFLAIVLLVASYLVGIAMSELGRIVDWIISKFFTKEYTFDNMESIKRAMANSKFWEEQTDMEVNTIAIKMMYSDIQTDENYKRIHNYASAGVMYKNMFTSLLGGNIILLFRHIFFGINYPYFNICFCVLLFLALIFLVRWKRFEGKTNNYTINWFIKKYTN